MNRRKKVALGAALTLGLAIPGQAATATAAEAAWWHFTVRDWGTHCGYDRTGDGKTYLVKRWAYGWTSDYPTCQLSGEEIIV